MLQTTTLLSLGVFALLNTIKLLIPQRLSPGGKLLSAAILSLFSVVWAATSVAEGFLLWAGVFGLSTLFHGLHKTLEASGDERRAETLMKDRR